MQTVSLSKPDASLPMRGNGYHLVQALRVGSNEEIVQNIEKLWEFRKKGQISNDEFLEIFTMPTEPGIPCFLNENNWFRVKSFLGQLRKGRLGKDLLQKLVLIQSKNGTDLLNLAIMKNDLDCIKQFVEAGADLDPNNSHQMNRIGIAVANGHHQTLQYLINCNNSNVNIVGKFNQYPYEDAQLNRRTPSRLRVIEILKPLHEHHERSELFFHLKAIGNVLEFSGKTFCLGSEDEIALEGLRPPKFAFDVLSRLPSFLNYLNEAASVSLRAHIAETAEMLRSETASATLIEKIIEMSQREMASTTLIVASRTLIENMKEMLHRFVFPKGDGICWIDYFNIQKKISTCIEVGYNGHSCFLIFYGDRLAICDTSGATDPVRYFHYNNSQISSRLLLDINRFYFNGAKEDYETMVNNLILKELDCKQTALDLYLQKNAPELNQIMGNCPWASLSAGIYAFFTFELFPDQIDLTAKDEVEKKIEIAKNLHRKWLNFEKVSVLKNLVHFIDAHEGICSKINWSLVRTAFHYCHTQAFKRRLTNGRFHTIGIAYDKDDPLCSEVKALCNNFTNKYDQYLGLPPSSNPHLLVHENNSQCQMVERLKKLVAAQLGEKRKGTDG